MNGQPPLSYYFTQNGFMLMNQYIVGRSGEQMTELVPTVPTMPTAPSPASEVGMTWVHNNVYAGGKLVATYANNGTGPHFRLTDWLGTKRAQTNYAGALEQTCQSLPFCDGPQCTGHSEQFYPGSERDTDTENEAMSMRATLRRSLRSATEIDSMLSASLDFLA